MARGLEGQAPQGRRAQVQARARDPRRGRQALLGGITAYGEATAFAPGHVTGFFQIENEAEDPSRIGSRGAGFSVRLGVTSRVRIAKEGWPGIELKVNGAPHEAGTSRAAIELLLPSKELCVSVEQRMDLPVSQGFGMSAAGALSAALATAQILGRTRKEAVFAAHAAEVVEGTGLGDVVGAALGGFETRLEPGLEPHGRIENFRLGEPVDTVLLAVVDREILTKRILADPQQRARINEAGAEALQKFRQRPGLAALVEESQAFSIKSRLASQKILDVYDALKGRCLVSQCMLGGSVFVFGPDPAVRKILQRYGSVHEAKIDFEGARLLAENPARPA